MSTHWDETRKQGERDYNERRATCVVCNHYHPPEWPCISDDGEHLEREREACMDAHSAGVAYPNY